MDYTTEAIGKLTVVGIKRRFHYDSAFDELPKFWKEYYERGLNQTEGAGVCGRLPG